MHRPKVQKTFSSFYSYDKHDGDSSPRLQSSSSKSTTIDSSIAPTSSETPIKTTELLAAPSDQALPTPRKSLSPVAKRENGVSISSVNSSVSSGSSSSSKNVSSSSKKNNINDRFIVPKSKLDLLLEPIQLSPTTTTDRSYTTNSYAKNSYAKANYASNNNDKQKIIRK